MTSLKGVSIHYIASHRTAAHQFGITSSAELFAKEKLQRIFYRAFILKGISCLRIIFQHVVLAIGSKLPIGVPLKQSSHNNNAQNSKTPSMQQKRSTSKNYNETLRGYRLKENTVGVSTVKSFDPAVHLERKRLQFTLKEVHNINCFSFLRCKRLINQINLLTLGTMCVMMRIQRKFKC